MLFNGRTLTLVAGLLLAASGSPLQADNAPAGIVGIWRGHSECAVRSSSCRDEENVYRFKDLPGKPGWFSGAGSKIVNGQEVLMGTLEWRYDPAKRELVSKSPAGSFRLVADGDKMEGTLTLADKTVFRRIHLEREK
jgi:hypothetical protein